MKHVIKSSDGKEIVVHYREIPRSCLCIIEKVRGTGNIVSLPDTICERVIDRVEEMAFSELICNELHISKGILLADLKPCPLYNLNAKKSIFLLSAAFRKTSFRIATLRKLYSKILTRF